MSKYKQRLLEPTEENLENIKKALNIYKENFLNKKILILYSNFPNKNLNKISIEKLKIVGIEISFKKENFIHLVGIPRTAINISPKEFYDKLILDKISLKEFKLSEYANKKHFVFSDLPNSLKSVGLVGEYNYSKPYIDADIIVGNTKKIYSPVLGIREINSKNSLKVCIPVTLLEEITENLVKKETQRKILTIFEKNINDRYYNNLLYKNKNYHIENIYYNKNFYNLLSYDIQEKYIHK